MPAAPLTRAECESLDAADPLAAFAAKFALPEGVLYLDGNSLGALPAVTAAHVAHVIEEEWGRGLITSWAGARWWERPQLLGDRLSPLLGAAPGQVVLGDSTSVDLFKVLVAALGLRPGRSVVISDSGNFPTDLYLLRSVAALVGAIEVRLIERDEQALAAALDDDVAAVLLTHVDYRSAEMLDMGKVTAAVHGAGALMIWDLCHSAGAVPLALDDCEVDLAVGCTYKYLNGGPGSPAFIYAAARHLPHLDQPLAGWGGHARPFDFEATFEPAEGIGRFNSGTPQILSLSALEASLAIFEQVDLPELWHKREALSGLLIALVAERCGERLALASPPEPARRGSHVAYRHPHARELQVALAARGVLGDFRPPDLLRLGLAPLYLSHCNVFDAVEILAEVLDEQGAVLG